LLARLIGLLLVKELESEVPAGIDVFPEQAPQISADSSSLLEGEPNTTSEPPSKALPAPRSDKLPAFAQKFLRPSQPGFAPTKLRPAEIAYLAHRGDMSHALLVLGADILQRAIKSQISDNPLPVQAPYEAQAWSLARDQVGDWAKRRVGEALPPDVRHDPIGFARGMSKIYRFFAVSVRAFVAKTLEDPRHIRKYISFGGVLRLLVSLSAAGYQEGLESGLRDELNRRGMLVSQERRLYYSKLMLLLAVIVGGASMVLTWYFIQPIGIAIASWTAAGLIAVALQATFFLREFIPLYNELMELAAQIGRGGVRLSLLRLALTIVTSLCRLSSVVVFTVGALLVWLIFGFLLHMPPEVIQMTLVLTICQMASILSFIASWRIAHEARPTARALAEIREVRQRIDKTHALDAIKTVLTSPDYDETFGEMLALYGVEALLVIL
jgi:hypothetical protein